MNILLAPEKIVFSVSKEQWLDLKPSEIILFTSKSEAAINYFKCSDNHIFKHVEFFDNYATNDLVELQLLEYANKYEIKNIIPMTEADILRVATIKEKLNIDGLSLCAAIPFRDKIAMKELAQKANISVPRFKRIKTSVDVIEFIEEVGYPIIIKPILGRGSMNTVKISNQLELEKLLNKGFISDTSRYPDLLAEEYLDAEIYHIDGLQIENEIKVFSVSKYVNNCLSFVNGSYLGSYTLSLENPLRKKLIHFSQNLIDAFPLYKNAIFHIEVFVDNDNNIFLCEIACRLGGNGINEEVKLQQGIDIKMEYIKAECGIENQFKREGKACELVAGRLLIPPKDGLLISIPEICEIDGVIKYQARGVSGNSYKKMSMSNDEIANFLIKSHTEAEICEKISAIFNWFNHQVVWS